MYPLNKKIVNFFVFNGNGIQRLSLLQQQQKRHTAENDQKLINIFEHEYINFRSIYV